MRESSGRERAALAGCVLLLAVLLGSRAATRVSPGPAALSPVVLARLGVRALAVLALAGVVVSLLRWLLAARMLRGRVTLELLPADAFPATPDAIRRFAGQLARTRRGFLTGWLQRPGAAVRVLLTHDEQGTMSYLLQMPASSRRAVEAALSAYSGLEITERADPLAARAGGQAWTVRAELRLALRASLPLGDAGLDPDPLQGFASVLGQLYGSDRACVAIDLLACTSPQSRRFRKRLFRNARRSAPMRAGGLGDVFSGEPRSGGRLPPADTVDRLFQTKGLQRKLDATDPLFQTQILLSVTSADAGRARMVMHALLACFDAFNGENYLRAAGLRFGGLGFLGADAPWRRKGFDTRLRTGWFAPVRRGSMIAAGEIAGLLKPPSARCVAENVTRSVGAAVTPPPPGLPTYTGQKGLIPLGKVIERSGERIVGVPVAGTYFLYMAGKSRYGKTSTAEAQFIPITRAGDGGMFIDPHADALAEIRPYFTDPGIRERVVDINLSDSERDEPGPTWNLFGLQRRTAAEAAGKVEAFVDALAASMRWDERNTRALNLATQAAQALIELALQLPAVLAPTIFQVPTLLSDQEWREAILPALSTGTQGFFRDRFPRLPPEAVTAVTNLVDQLRQARPVAAFLGSPVSTYDAQRAMRDGSIVLVCPGRGARRNRLMSNLLVYDVLHAAQSRASIPVEQRRLFWLFCDELQTYDSPNLRALLEQSAKYGGRAFLFNQNPERLTDATWNAVTTNRSHLLTSAVNAKAAAMIAREWSGQLDPKIITGLERYTYLASVTHGDRTSKPFLVRGMTARELHGEHYHPEQIGELRAATQRTSAMQPVSERLAALEKHDERIRDAVQELLASRATKTGGVRSQGRSIALADGTLRTP
jgi:hypothetical protein